MSGAGTSGRLIGVVGPSGVGKDSVMQAVARAHPGVHLARRVITRPADAGGEDFDGVSDAQFDQMVAEGAFALHWAAHGLRYGIPKRVDQVLAAGGDVLVNLSRAVLPEAQARFAGFAVLSLSAPVEVLATRLAQRGREAPADIARRLARADTALPDGLDRVIPVDNGGALNDTVTAVLAAISRPAPTARKTEVTE